MRNEVVFVLTEVRDNSFTSTVLIEVYRRVKGVTVAVLPFNRFTLVNFVFVKDWVLGLEQVVEVVAEQVRHTSGIET